MRKPINRHGSASHGDKDVEDAPPTTHAMDESEDGMPPEFTAPEIPIDPKKARGAFHKALAQVPLGATPGVAGHDHTSPDEQFFEDIGLDDSRVLRLFRRFIRRNVKPS
jgi:hypothetical protein